MAKTSTAFLFSVITTLILYVNGTAQNPCADIGSGCRLMTAPEVKAFKERLMAIKALLPVPDPAQYKHDVASEASTMPFIAESGIPKAVLTCRSYPGGCFPESPYNTLYFAYFSKTDDKTTEKTKDPPAASMAAMTEFENRIEVMVWVLPHPYLESDLTGSEAVNVERNQTYLSWETGEDYIDIHMVFGSRTGQESETLIGEKPVTHFAPVNSIELVISGPKDEVSALRSEINKTAFAALLGPVVK